MKRLWLLWVLGCCFSVAALQPMGLDAPVPDEVYAFAQNSLAYMHARTDFGNPQPLPTVIPGWPSISGSVWSFQYPPDWLIRGNGPTYGWVSDNRDRTHVLFVTLDEATGNLSIEALFYTVLNNVLANHSNNDVRILASDWTNILGPYAGSDAGHSQMWVFRWLDTQSELMIATLQITLYAQGITTSYGWSFMSCPENELNATSQHIFGPVANSFWSPPPGGSSDDEDTDGDGYPDGIDAYPYDPNQH